MIDIKFRARDCVTGKVLPQLYMGQCFQWVNHEMQHNVIIEQFTGLKDINGVEIYEGDVVVDSEFITKRGYPVEHGKFDAQVQGSVCEVICIGFHVDGSPLSPTGEYKVIGNIYENPELLK